MRIFLFFIILNSSFLFSDIGHGIIEQYKNNIFISTGFSNGLNTVKAINANFGEVICIEQDKIIQEHANYVISAYFIRGFPQSLQSHKIIHGESTKILSSIINLINQPITLLLCSHLPEPDHPEKVNSILDELEIIKNHQIKQHIFLIDYINWAGTVWFSNVTLKSITDKILSINPNYKFRFEKGGLLERQENAILIAYL